MKTIIRENERGLLFQNGIYKRLLTPGTHRVHTILGQSIEVAKAEGRLYLKSISPKLLMRDTAFAESVAVVDVPDGQIALHFVDGRLADSLPPGEHYFWKAYETHTFRLIEVNRPEAADIPAEYFLHIPIRQYVKVEVFEGECALLYYDGAFQKLLSSGCHYFWNCGVKVTAQKVDLRVQQMEIGGQEILTADKVGLRLNFVCTFRVTDPVALVGELKDYAGQIYSAVQLALRKYVGNYKLDELLEQKDSVAGFVLQKLQAEQGRLFVAFQDAGLRDIILPGEIRNIMNTVLVAEKTAQANVISRREETASTRSLLNTAKLLDENETLRRLKEMEYLERICDRVGSISVTNGGGLLGQLKELIAVR